jgi:hypothetical protein
MLSRVLEFFGKSWNTFVQGCHAFDRVGIPLYRVAKLSTELEYHCTGLEWFLVGWNAF